MAHDMHDAAKRLGAAEMMLASASYAVHKHAAAQRGDVFHEVCSALPQRPAVRGQGRLRRVGAGQHHRRRAGIC